MSFSIKELLVVLEEMLLIRRFEERAGYSYGLGKIRGFCHLCIGQEAVNVGIFKGRGKDDVVITSYREHGMYLCASGSPRKAMAELFGKNTGMSKGKGGSMHFFDVENGFYGGHGIVGAQVPIGTGIAFKKKYSNEKGISITCLGDGAINQGQVYESFNMAKLWKLPVLYVIENNGYAMGTSVERACATTDLYNRGKSFVIDGIEVDGMDFFSVKRSIEKARKIVEKGTPFIIEMKTYRYKGHSMSDPGQYRTKKEVDEYKKDDPIDRIITHLKNVHKVRIEEIERIENKVLSVIDEAMSFAENSTFPHSDALYKDIILRGV